MTLSTSGSAITRARALRLFPNLVTTHPDTKFTLYRATTKTKIVEYTLFYKEPGKHKMRIDAEVDITKVDPEAGSVTLQDLMVIKWDQAAATLDSKS